MWISDDNCEIYSIEERSRYGPDELRAELVSARVPIDRQLSHAADGMKQDLQRTV